MAHPGFATSNIDDVIDRTLSERRVVGAVVMVARDGEVIYRRAAGAADREEGRPMQEDALFRYASLSKPIVSAAAMALVERGKLRMDDFVTRWLPDFRPRNPDVSEAVITIRQLFTHTAGLTYSFFQPEDGSYRRAGISDGLDQPGLSMEEELRRLASVPLVYEPGTSWGYSLALDVLGAILERITQTSLSEVVERFVTGPLEMRDTGFSVRDPQRLAIPYVDGQPPRRMNDPDVIPFLPGLAGVRFSPSRAFDPSSFPSSGAGMVGSAGDLMTLLETVRRGGGSILKPSTVHEMMTNQIGDLRITTEPTPSWGFGFGGSVLMNPELAGLPLAKGTWKRGGGYGHHWYVDPTNRLTVVALTNTGFEGMKGKFVTDLMRAVYQN